MPEKRESPEGVYGAVPRGPRDKAKAILPESQSPVVELHTRCYNALIAVPQEQIVRVSRSAPSAWRGDGRNTSAPNRERSNREAALAIISIAQHAKPNVRGHIALRRAQLTSSSS